MQIYFDTIKTSTKQLYTLIEDFANYTNLSKDEEIELQPVDLNSLMSNLQQTLDGTIKEYNGQVFYSNLPIIQSSNSLLFPVLKNIIENGLKYNQSAIPTVKITYKETDQYHQITLADNGIGIEEQYHEKVFEMFKRLHNRSEYKGSGIGLAIVKLLVDKLEGSINIISQPKNGSKFIISIPIK